MIKFVVAVTAFGILCASAGFLANNYIKTLNPQIQTLDINRVIHVNETILASKDLSPEALTQEAKLFVLRLQDEIANLQKNCNCVLLVSSAVIPPSKLPDRTQDLLVSLGFTDREMARAEALLESRIKKLEPNP